MCEGAEEIGLAVVGVAGGGQCFRSDFLPPWASWAFYLANASLSYMYPDYRYRTLVLDLHKLQRRRSWQWIHLWDKLTTCTRQLDLRTCTVHVLQNSKECASRRD